MEELFQQFAAAVATSVEAAAALFIAVGAAEAIYLVLRRFNPHARSNVLRRKEIFVLRCLAGSRARVRAGGRRSATAISPTWDDVGKLAAIAAIRTALNFFLEKDIEKYAIDERVAAR